MLLEMKKAGLPCQVLSAGDNRIDTNEMGDCMSAIVYAGRQADGTYATVRGYHGYGGIEVVNWDSLLDGIIPQLVVIVGPGPGLDTSYRRAQAQELVDAQIQPLEPPVIPQNYYFGMSRAVFDRTGNLIP